MSVTNPLSNSAELAISDALAIDTRQNRELRQFLIFATLVTTWMAFDQVLRLLTEDLAFGLLTTYALPVFGGGMAFFLWQFGRQGRADVPRLPAYAGIAFIVGGAGFDISMTVLKSPDLSDEANPYIRLILDTGHSLHFVYTQAFLTQLAYITLFCLFWLAFLRHRAILLNSIVAAQPVSPLEFLKAATGGAGQTTRQWLFPLRPAEFAGLYHWVWTIGITVIFSLSLLRFYVALEWLDVFEPTLPRRAAVLVTGMTAALILYFVALAWLYGKRRRT
jgi:hypothetical protein